MTPAAFAQPFLIPLFRAPRSLTSRHPPTCSAATPRSPRVVIDYCTGCRWSLRATWVAQELLATFEAELGEVALRPNREGGVFDVWVDEERVWCRHKAGRFPELREVKQRVRDRVAAGRDLGHSDRGS